MSKKAYYGDSPDLFTVLEKNISKQSLIDLKFDTKDSFTALAMFLTKIFPKLSVENAGKFLYLAIALASSIFSMTSLSNVQKEVLEMPEFAMMKIDFKEYYRDSVTYILEGLTR